MAKDKKKKKKDKAGKAAKRLRSLTENPLVAEVVSTALVATAAALRDSKKARQLAVQAGDELTQLAKEGAEKGNAMWQLALEIGRRSLDALIAEPAPKARKAPKAPKTPKAPKAPRAARPARKPKPRTARRKRS